VGSSPGFPTTPGAFQTSPSGGNNDAYVTKFSSDGSALDYSTYLGGTYHPAPRVSQGNGIAVDSSGNAYVTGATTSGNFPLTGGAFQITNNCTGCANAFVTKFNADGTALDYSTYLGGAASPYGIDAGLGIAIDSLGSAYVAGNACSNNFPTTIGAFKRTNSGFCDVFATKLKSDGSDLVYSTYLGGNQPDQAAGIGVDSAGHAYVAGMTQSSNFPVTAGAFQTTMRTIYGNAFVTELKTDGFGLVYSTYLGGYGDTADSLASGFGADVAHGIAVDPAGHSYVTGATWSSTYYCTGPANPIKCCIGAGAGTCNFPITADAFQTTDNASDFSEPGPNAFITKMNLAGSGLDYSTIWVVAKYLTETMRSGSRSIPPAMPM